MTRYYDIMDNRDAKAIFARVFRGNQNLLTPDPMYLTMTINKTYAVELATGIGIKQQPLFGVTVVHVATERSMHDMSQVFFNVEEALAYYMHVVKEK